MIIPVLMGATLRIASLSRFVTREKGTKRECEGWHLSGQRRWSRWPSLAEVEPRAARHFPFELSSKEEKATAE
jgi:hypothetical protein